MLVNGKSVGAVTSYTFDEVWKGHNIQVMFAKNRPNIKENNPFTDVPYGPDTHWYYDAVLWAQQNGLMQGYGANLFGPNDPVTREQLVMIFYRYEQWRGNDTAASGNLSRFTDVGEVSPWAREAMQWAEGLSAARAMESLTQKARQPVQKWKRCSRPLGNRIRFANGRGNPF